MWTIVFDVLIFGLSICTVLYKNGGPVSAFVAGVFLVFIIIDFKKWKDGKR